MAQLKPAKSVPVGEGRRAIDKACFAAEGILDDLERLGERIAPFGRQELSACVQAAHVLVSHTVEGLHSTKL